MAAGQYLGRRGVFLYDGDDGNNYLISLDATLGNIAEVGLTEVDATSGAGIPKLPKDIQPRYVNWQGVCDGATVRKRLVCGQASTAYSAGTTTAFDIGGSTGGSTTSRVGERETFLRLPATIPTTP